ncbi:MAG TPA: hypothetical protein VMP01_10330 [Pirellulaceae bacterium]|nr:hypothetical protein [Pirellulaceae bacterium]
MAVKSRCESLGIWSVGPVLKFQVATNAGPKEEDARASLQRRAECVWQFGRRE